MKHFAAAPWLLDLFVSPYYGWFDKKERIDTLIWIYCSKIAIRKLEKVPKDQGRFCVGIFCSPQSVITSAMLMNGVREIRSPNWPPVITWWMFDEPKGLILITMQGLIIPQERLTLCISGAKGVYSGLYDRLPVKRNDASRKVIEPKICKFVWINKYSAVNN